MNKFKRIIKDLQKAGWTQCQIADFVGCSQGNIGRLLKDRTAEPRWSTGDALIGLHEREIRK